ncbi:hypothetical protein EVA_02399 [gut metagenome]|uniref:Uncharacterized protein n=1 Tax=gut metagenome TaxID=749906 RepID=J9GN43_9ZZZZ
MTASISGHWPCGRRSWKRSYACPTGLLWHTYTGSCVLYN